MKNILPYQGITPKIDPSAFIASNALISGDVEVGKNVGIWYGCVIRGDVISIKIGDNTNIQDNTVLHGTRPHHVQNKTGAAGGPVVIGKNVTIGHNAIIHACVIKDNAFIGMGAIVMDLAVVEEYAMLAAGAVLAPGRVVKSGQLWGGNPARYMRDLTQAEKDYIHTSAQNYMTLAEEYSRHF